MLNNRIWAGLAACVTALALTACGGKGNSTTNASVRLVNATLTHSSLSLLANSTAVVNATALDVASDYVAVTAGSPALQVNDATTSTALATLAPSLGGNGHYALVAYESGGAIRTVVIAEDVAAPAAGTATVRVLNAATDAGAVDVFITDPAVDIATLTSPSFTFSASTALQTSGTLSLAPGNFRIRVTGSGNPSDLRLDFTGIAIANQQIANVLLTPTTGGTLVNGSVLSQQSAYTPGRNKTARVRLAAAVSGTGTAVSASTAASGSTPGTSIAASVIAPSVSAYAIVPANSALNITVNSATVAAPATAVAAGSDLTLLVYGAPGSAVASLITDDNHLPASTANLKLRLVNGITGPGATPLTLNAAFAVVASNVPSGAASPYAVVASSTSLQLDVFSPSSVTPIYTTTSSTTPLSLPGNAVYTLFMLGDISAPIHLLRKDR